MTVVHQAKHFGIDLLCQAIMSNHIHLVLRSRPDVVKEWDNTEVARRWLMLCPVRRDENRQPEEPTEFELINIRNDKETLEQSDFTSAQKRAKELRGQCSVGSVQRRRMMTLGNRRTRS